MRTVVRVCLVFVGATALFSSALSYQGKVNKSEKIKSTKHIVGKLVAFEVGDYVHAVIVDGKGKQESYFVTGPEVEYFLAAHAKKTAHLTVQTVDAYIEEAAQRMVIERITAASIGKLNAKSWWSRQLKGHKRDAVFDRYEKLMQSLATNGTSRPLKLALDESQGIVALDGWVIGVRVGSRWQEGSKSLNGHRAMFSTFKGSQAGKSVEKTVEYSDGPPQPSLSLKSVEKTTPSTLYVSGQNVRFANVSRIPRNDKNALVIARKYAVSKAKGSLPVVVEDGLVADLNADGKKDVILAVSSGATLQTKKAKDYSALILSTWVGGKNKIIELDYQSKLGEQRGPFKDSVIGAGWIDGTSNVTFIVSSEDPWSLVVTMFQLSKSGKLTRVWSAANGE